MYVMYPCHNPFSIHISMNVILPTLIIRLTPYLNFSNLSSSSNTTNANTTTRKKQHQLPQLHRHGPTLILLSIRMHGHIFPLPFTPQPIANNIFQDQPLIVSHNCHTTNHVQSYISSFTSFFCAIITITVSVIPHAKITFINSHFFVKATTTIAINGTLVLLLYPPPLISNTTSHLSNSTSSTSVFSLI